MMIISNVLLALGLGIAFHLVKQWVSRSAKEALWRQMFFEAWRMLLNTTPSGQTAAGVEIAVQARALADDAMREASRPSGQTCAECRGVGCEACKFQGKIPRLRGDT